MTVRRARVAVIDYGAGNVRSARRGFDAAGADAFITDTPDVARDADVLVVPGVGHFSSCVSNLRKAGFGPLLSAWISSERPLFGICVGMQLLYHHSEEGDQPGLGLLPGKVVRFPSTSVVPHLGWNVVTPAHAHPLFEGVAGQRFYFTHSYFAVPDDDSHVLAYCTYGEVTFPCVVQEANVTGTQFHPEKSGPVGARFLHNWLNQL